LGTSTSKDTTEYFLNILNHTVSFRFSGEDDKNSIDLAFSKDKANERKEWLKKRNEVHHRHQAKFGLPNFFYRNSPQRISFEQFINNDFILYCNKNNERSIPKENPFCLLLTTFGG